VEFQNVVARSWTRILLKNYLNANNTQIFFFQSKGCPALIIKQRLI